MSVLNVQTVLVAAVRACMLGALNPPTTPVWDATARFLAAFGYVAMAFGVITVFEKRPPAYEVYEANVVVALVVIGGDTRRVAVAGLS